MSGVQVLSLVIGDVNGPWQFAAFVLVLALVYLHARK